MQGITIVPSIKLSKIVTIPFYILQTRCREIIALHLESKSETVPKVNNHP
jgi:hypothetical protein